LLKRKIYIQYLKAANMSLLVRDGQGDGPIIPTVLVTQKSPTNLKSQKSKFEVKRDWLLA
jgi:hypothetical protein